MKKRIAYVGLSYPIMFDITKRLKSWLSPGTPVETFPILESPWGLMLLYDELWFLCEDVCPVNMRKCEFVKFVTDLFPAINYIALFDKALAVSEKPKCDLLTDQEFYQVYVPKLNYWPSVSTASSDICWVKDLPLRAGTLPENYMFDVLVKEQIERRSFHKVEVIANSKVYLEEYILQERKLELSSTLILNGIPNYLTRQGPYHPVVEELRDNKNLKYYRKWIMSAHPHLLRVEMKEAQEVIEQELLDIQEKMMLRYFDEHTIKSLVTSSAKTVICTSLEVIPVAGPIIGGIVGMATDVVEFASDAKEMKNSDNDRWAAFTVEARNTLKNRQKELG